VSCPDCTKQLTRVAAHVHIGGRLLHDQEGSAHRVLGCATMPGSGKTVVRMLDEKGNEYVAAPCVLKTFTFPGVA
jgi:hypothetical protein